MQLHEWNVPEVLPYSDSYSFSNGLAVHASGEDPNSRVYGYTDRHGQWRIKPQYERAYSFYDGLARVVLKNENNRSRSVFIDTFGNVRIHRWGLGENFRYGLAWDGSFDRDTSASSSRYINLAGETVWSDR